MKQKDFMIKKNYFIKQYKIQILYVLYRNH